MLADGEVPAPTTVFGLLCAVITGIVAIMGLVIKWMMNENTAARLSAAEAWKTAFGSAEQLRQENVRERAADRAFFSELASASRENALAWQQLTEQVPKLVPESVITNMKT